MLKGQLELFIATIDLPSHEVLTKVQEYLEKQNLFPKTAQLDTKTFCVTTNPIPTFWQLLSKKSPAESEWIINTISPFKTKIQIQFNYPPRFWLNSFIIAMLFILTFFIDIIILDPKYCNQNQWISLGITQMGCFMLITITFWRYAIALFRISDKNGILKENFCDPFRRAGNINILNEGSTFPFRNFVISILATALIICILIFFKLSKEMQSAILSIILPILLVLTILIGFIFLSIKDKTFGVKFTVGLGGLLPASAIITAYNIPFIFSADIFARRILDWHSIPPVMRIAGLLFMATILIMLIGIPIWFIKRAILNVERLANHLISLKYSAKDSIYAQGLETSLNYFHRLLIWFFWLLLFIGTVSAIYCAISIIGIVLLGPLLPSFMNATYSFFYWSGIFFILTFTGFLPQSVIILIYNGFLLLFAGLFLFLFFYPLCLRLKDTLKWRTRLRKGETKEYDHITKSIAGYLGIKPPRVAILDSVYWAKAIHNYVALDRWAIDEFRGQPEQLYALIVHEMGHLKRHHSFKLRLYNTLSQIALMGKSFLLILTDFYQQEYEADKTAVDWLAYHYKCSPEQARMVMIKTLESTRGTIGSEPDKRSEWRKFIDLYFFGRPEIYFHPSIDQRIEQLLTYPNLL